MSDTLKLVTRPHDGFFSSVLVKKEANQPQVKSANSREGSYGRAREIEDCSPLLCVCSFVHASSVSSWKVLCTYFHCTRGRKVQGKKLHFPKVMTMTIERELVGPSVSWQVQRESSKSNAVESPPNETLCHLRLLDSSGQIVRQVWQTK